MSDEFWDVVGSEVEEQGKAWKCRRFLDDAWTADQETQLFDVVCGYAVTDQSGEDVKDQCSQCGLYRLKCTCEGRFFFCNLRGGVVYPVDGTRVKCPKADR